METTNPEHHTITHIWERFHLQWKICGALAGIAAGLLVIVISSALSLAMWGDAAQPFKLIGAGLFGYEATAYGPLGVAGFTGLVIHLGLSALYGLVFAQLVHENSRLGSLVILGIVTSLIIWVFSCMLFLPSFNVTLALFLNKWVGLALHLLFGLVFGIFIHLIRNKILTA